MASPIFQLLLILALCVPVPLYGQRTPVNRTGDNIQFTVFIYTPSPQAEKIRQIAGALFQKGYLVSAPMERKVGEAVINYYDDSAKGMAEEVAATVKAFGGPEPKVLRGRGGPVNGFDVWLP